MNRPLWCNRGPSLLRRGKAGGGDSVFRLPPSAQHRRTRCSDIQHLRARDAPIRYERSFSVVYLRLAKCFTPRTDETYHLQIHHIHHLQVDHLQVGHIQIHHVQIHHLQVQHLQIHHLQVHHLLRGAIVNRTNYCLKNSEIYYLP